MASRTYSSIFEVMQKTSILAANNGWLCRADLTPDASYLTCSRLAPSPLSVPCSHRPASRINCAAIRFWSTFLPHCDAPPHEQMFARWSARFHHQRRSWREAISKQNVVFTSYRTKEHDRRSPDRREEHASGGQRLARQFSTQKIDG